MLLYILPLIVEASEALNSICERLKSLEPAGEESGYSSLYDEKLRFLEVLRYLGYARLERAENGVLVYSENSGTPIPILVNGEDEENPLFTEACREIRKVSNPKKDFANYEIELASGYYESGKIDESLLTIKIIDDLKKEEFYSLNLGRYYRLKGIEAFYSGQNQLLPRYFRKSLQEAAGMDDHLCVANSYMGLGNYHSWLGELEKAIENFERALSEYTEIGYRPGIAKVKLNIALSMLKSGRIWEATNSIEDGINLLSNLREDFLLQYAYMYKALIMKAVDRYQDSLDNFQSAIDLSQVTGNAVVYHLSRLGVVSINALRNTGNYSIKALEEAKVYFLKSNDINHLAAVYTAFCNYYVAIKDEAGLEWALERLLTTRNENIAHLKNEMIGHFIEIFKVMKIQKYDPLLIRQTGDKIISWLRSPDYIKEFKSMTQMFMGDY